MPVVCFDDQWLDWGKLDDLAGAHQLSWDIGQSCCLGWRDCAWGFSMVEPKSSMHSWAAWAGA